jgi:hypothetical protein
MEMPVYITSTPSGNGIGVKGDMGENKVVKLVGPQNVVEERTIVFKFEDVVVSSDKFLSPFERM